MQNASDKIAAERALRESTDESPRFIRDVEPNVTSSSFRGLNGPRPVRPSVDQEEAQKRFYDLLWPHLAAVLRAAGVLCGGNFAEAEDLAQETMLKAFRA